MGLELPPQLEPESPSAHGLVSLTKAQDSRASLLVYCWLPLPDTLKAHQPMTAEGKVDGVTVRSDCTQNCCGRVMSDGQKQ